MATELTHKFLLFEAQASDASSGAVVLTHPGDKYVIVSGTLGGGTLNIEISDNAGNFVVMDGGDFTTTGARILFSIPKSARIRATLTGATAPSLNVEVTK